MASTVRAGEKGVDFSFARPPADVLIRDGYTFVVGYMSVPPASSAKNLTRFEIDAYLAAGLKVLLVWEMSANTPDQGAARGAVDGAHALRLARAIGYPADVPILAACDTNSTAANISRHEGYVRAFAGACAPYPVGVYGDTDIVERVRDISVCGWVPNAWSWSSTSRPAMEAKARQIGAHVLQRRGFHIDNRWAVDPNECVRDFPAWGRARVERQEIIVTHPQQIEDEDMQYATNAEPRNYEGTTWPPDAVKYAIMADGTLRHIGGTEAKARALTLHGLGTPMSNAELDEMGETIQFGTVELTQAVTSAMAGNINLSVSLNGSASGSVRVDPV